ncbi:MAG: hypothetical protein OQL08_10560 [Gammaproteobacteria bacterium]|nr:hypothetical protein [Gammaproteobacteria bacterium]
MAINGGLTKRVTVAAWIIVPLFFGGTLSAQPDALEMPDVRANVIRMLEEARRRGEATVLLPGEEGWFRLPPEMVETGQEPDLFDRLQQEVTTVAMPPPKPAVPVGESEAAQAREEQLKAQQERPQTQRAKQELPPLTLPNKEITIRDLRDLKGLAEEFQQATPRP